MAATTPNPHTTPRILATVSIPPIVSFCSPEEPQLQISLCLLDADYPITFALHQTFFYPFTKSLSLRNVRTSNAEYLNQPDINWGCNRSIVLSRDKFDDFVTLSLNEPYVRDFGFRPPEYPYLTEEQRKELPLLESFKRVLNLGMHNLMLDEEYDVGVKEGLRIGLWQAGTKEEILGEEQAVAWLPRTAVSDRIEVEAAPMVRFKVEA